MNDKILIVDDAKFARKILRQALANGNYTNVVEAVNAKEALEKFENEKPDLTFLDISLPDSNDLGLLKKLMEINPNGKVVMCSALGQNLIIENAIRLGAKDFITKPFEEKMVLEIVCHQLVKA